MRRISSREIRRGLHGPQRHPKGPGGRKRVSRGPQQHPFRQGKGPGRNRRNRLQREFNTEVRRQGHPSERRFHRQNRAEFRGNRRGIPGRSRRHNRYAGYRRANQDHHKNSRRRHSWKPLADFCVLEDRYEVVVELPGVSQNDVNITLIENHLTVKGKKQRGQSKESVNIRRPERRFGKFRRSFPVPPNVVVDEIKAEFKDGILTVALPKSEQAKPTEILINVNS